MLDESISEKAKMLAETVGAVAEPSPRRPVIDRSLGDLQQLRSLIHIQNGREAVPDISLREERVDLGN